MISARDQGFQSLLRNTQKVGKADEAMSLGLDRPTVRNGMPPPNRMLSRPALVNRAVPWAGASDLKVNLRRLPDAWGTLEIYKYLSPFGNLDRIEVYESRGDRTKNGYVIFRPPPQSAHWLKHGLTVVDQNGSRQQIDCIPDRSTRPGGTSPERRSAAFATPLSQLDAGIMQSEEEMRVLFTASHGPPVTVIAKADRNELEVRFGVQAQGEQGAAPAARQFKLWLGFSQMKHVCDLSSATGEKALLITMEQPAVLYRQTTVIEETHRQDVLAWNESKTWYRQTAIDERPNNSDEVTQLPKVGVILDLGRWVTYRLAFGDTDAASFQAIGQALIDHNVAFTPMSNAVFTAGHARDLWSWHDDLAPSSGPPSSSVFDELHSLTKPLAQLDFSVRYHLEVALSHGALSECNMQQAPDFIAQLGSLDPAKASRLLEKVAAGKKRFYNPSDIFRLQVSIRHKKIPRYCAMVPAAVVTPSTIYFTTPTMETSNRVIREYHQYGDRFLRVKFTDERYKGRIMAGDNDTMNQVLTRVYRTMKNGIKVGDRHYDFLAFGNAQFREHGAYFFASTGAVTAASIRQWMGNFTKIQVVAKYASRLGQCFSTTRAVSLRVDIEPISDIERNGFCFTDGVGKISPFLAQMIADEYGLPTTDYPSVFQFRLGGCKGVLAVDPTLNGRIVQIRPSQEKFPAIHQGLEICRISQFSTSNLNVQIILVLNALGVKDEVFRRKMHQALSDLAAAMVDERKATEQLCRNIDFSQTTLILADMIYDGFMSASEPFLISCLRLWHSWMVKYLKEKARIPVEQGAFVIGCVDETTTLQGHFYNTCRPDRPATLPEIFLQIPALKNTYKVVTGVCVLARNPSLHPGDIRVVQAVDVQALHHLKNCVVLPQTGDRDLGNMCSGGDLDGDDYLVMWDEELIPKQWTEAPMDYEAPQPIVSKGPVTVDDMTSFFVKHMKNDNLGRIAMAHRYWADLSPDGVKDEKCLELANLHSMAVDYAKTGVAAQMPPRLRVKKKPHWANPLKGQTYHSNKVLGQLYDMVQRKDFHAAWDLPFDTRILKAFQLSDAVLQDAADVKLQYDEAVRRIMAQHGIKSEFEVWTTFVLEHNSDIGDYKFSETMSETVTALKQCHQNLCYEKAGTSAKERERDWSKMGPFVAAMYTITAREITTAWEANHEERLVGGQDLPARQSSYENMPFMSFPWIFAKELGLIARGRSPSSATVSQSMRKPAPKPFSTGLDDFYIPPPLPEIKTARGVVHEGDLLNIHHKDEVPLQVAGAAKPDSSSPLEAVQLPETSTTDVQINAKVQRVPQMTGDTPNPAETSIVPDGEGGSTLHVPSLPRAATAATQPSEDELGIVEAGDDNDEDDEMEEEVVVMAPDDRPSALDALQKLMGA
ncbi:hypothetical protein LTR08_003967 [Meristemomyces frigidus]|nr:hypothetical protein LTR08_003967 [Meristemomyces frigidus]